MQIHDLKRKTPSRSKKTVGRGGKRGKTSGRGTKGQRARAGHRIRPDNRDAIKRIPKKRGHKLNPLGKKPISLTLDRIARHFDSGSEITPTTLKGKGMIKRFGQPFKILGPKKKLEFKNKLIIRGCPISLPARKLVESLGGKVVTKDS